MIEQRYENDKKVYVKAAAFFHPDGKLNPLLFGAKTNADIKLIGLPTHTVPQVLKRVVLVCVINAWYVIERLICSLKKIGGLLREEISDN